MSFFAREVIYRDDYKSQKNRGIDTEFENSKLIKLNLNIPSQLATLKSPDWSFQDGYRFVLMIFPNRTAVRCADSFDQFNKELTGYITQALELGQGSDINYYDMEFNPRNL